MTVVGKTPKGYDGIMDNKKKYKIPVMVDLQTKRSLLKEAHKLTMAEGRTVSVSEYVRRAISEKMGR